MKKKIHLRPILLRGTCITAITFMALSLASFSTAHARSVGYNSALTITNEPLPLALERQLYTRPFEPTIIQPSDILVPGQYAPTHTIVGQKIDGIRSDLFLLQGKISEFSAHLSFMEDNGRQSAATYYANIATINTHLQAGTTPGNPRLTAHLNQAQSSLENLGGNVNGLNDLSIAAADAASLASILLGTTHATFALTGAVEEDHIHLAQLEEAISNTAMTLERLLNNINNDISRTTNYLRTEHANIRAVALAVRAGDLMGNSLANLPFSGAPQSNFGALPAATIATMPGMMAPMAGTPIQNPAIPPRPLVKIRFDHSNVDYEQPIYAAVNEALARYPNARFELVAVHPTTGNAAKQTIESTRARRNAEQVLRSLTGMGLTMDRINLSYTPSPQAVTSEVHLYIR